MSNLAEITNGYSILYLNNFIPADKEKFTKEKDPLKESLLSKRYDQTFNNFMIQLRQKAALVDNVKKPQTRPSAN
ncbi:MAG: hypothetical protein NT079_06040 [Candidatus Omnitrophica bacterium]|nr:hypothetical protein [Candidatus Omnitrophota bacterium]